MRTKQMGDTEIRSLRKDEDGKPMDSESLVEERLREHGTAHKIGDAKKTFECLYNEQDLSLDEIAKLLKVSRPSVTYAARQMGFDISRRGRSNLMLKRVRRQGFSSVADYFRAKDKDAPTPFEEMAKELKVCNATVEKHYAEFLREVSSKINPPA